ESLHPDDRDRALAILESQKTGQSFDHEYRIVRPDDSVRWIWNRGFPVRDDAGQVIRHVGVAVDITEHKRTVEALQNEKGFSESVIDSLPDAFYVLDRRGQPLRWNKNAEIVLGYSREELAALAPLAMVAEDERPLLVSKMRETFAEGSATVEVHLLTKDGRKIPYLLTATRAVIGDQVCLVGIGVDITERKKAEAER